MTSDIKGKISIYNKNDLNLICKTENYEPEHEFDHNKVWSLISVQRWILIQVPIEYLQVIVKVWYGSIFLKMEN